MSAPQQQRPPQGRRRLRLTLAFTAGTTAGFLVMHFIVTPILAWQAGG